MIDESPRYAEGCGSCSFGILSAPELSGAVEFYLERLAQMLDGEIEFCDCQAGAHYRISLMNREQKLIEEARGDQRMGDSANRGTHPDIESARYLIRQERIKMYREPTIHS